MPTIKQLIATLRERGALPRGFSRMNKAGLEAALEAALTPEEKAMEEVLRAMGQEVDTPPSLGERVRGAGRAAKVRGADVFGRMREAGARRARGVAAGRIEADVMETMARRAGTEAAPGFKRIAENLVRDTEREARASRAARIAGRRGERKAAQKAAESLAKQKAAATKAAMKVAKKGGSRAAMEAAAVAARGKAVKMGVGKLAAKALPGLGVAMSAHMVADILGLLGDEEQSEERIMMGALAGQDLGMGARSELAESEMSVLGQQADLALSARELEGEMELAMRLAERRDTVAEASSVISSNLAVEFQRRGIY